MKLLLAAAAVSLAGADRVQGQDAWYSLIMDDTYMQPGDVLALERECGKLVPQPLPVDEYLVLEIGGEFWSWPGWTPGIMPQQWTISLGGTYREPILSLRWPTGELGSAVARFWGGLTAPWTDELLAADEVVWGYGEPTPTPTPTPQPTVTPTPEPLAIYRGYRYNEEETTPRGPLAIVLLTDGTVVISYSETIYDNFTTDVEEDGWFYAAEYFYSTCCRYFSCGSSDSVSGQLGADSAEGSWWLASSWCSSDCQDCSSGESSGYWEAVRCGW